MKQSDLIEQLKEIANCNRIHRNTALAAIAELQRIKELEDRNTALLMLIDKDSSDNREAK